ncbi:hypothetical protein BS47DRAFT_1339069 [Hydnum rufescens UP504]|uniref:Uncharacterized protein n=1 Tax=Hydnum rufescens UP504 TaxID=1448309 RepID=A0A9P6B5M1_9AGAM|nr:hypothetical protein BS47DRAFT_1339069 [Hydnum rufescens UP504]
MQDDGVYITHLKPSNLTWRAVNSIWTPMKVGEKAKLAHKDILCFGTAPKTKAYSNKVDAPFTISVAFVPKGEEVSWTKYKFVKRTIHRPTPQPVKPRPMDSSMQLLLSDMNGLNVSLDATLDEESDDIHPPTVKRKRSDIAEGQGSDDDATHRVEDHGERKLAGRFAAEDTSKKRRLPESISRAYCDDVVALPESLTKMSLT